jgi:bifunctional ADP-heptose synthase (sugar kinase/adenylyltransferase)
MVMMSSILFIAMGIVALATALACGVTWWKGCCGAAPLSAGIVVGAAAMQTAVPLLHTPTSSVIQQQQQQYQQQLSPQLLSQHKESGCVDL